MSHQPDFDISKVIPGATSLVVAVVFSCYQVGSSSAKDLSQPSIAKGVSLYFNHRPICPAGQRLSIFTLFLNLKFILTRSFRMLQGLG